MDNKKIEELKNKRKYLQKELNQKLQKEKIFSQIDYLEKLGQSYYIYYNYENINWISSNITIRKRDGYNGIYNDFQIDVDDLKAFETLKIKESEIDSNKFTELLSSIIPNHNSLIVCYEGGLPELEISVTSFISKPTVFLSQPETWIISNKKNWILEYIWSQGVIRIIELNKSIPRLIKSIIIEEG